MAPSRNGQVALVTGAGRGIGAAICRSLGAAGIRVFAAARTSEQVNAVAKELAGAGGEATAITADIGKESDVLNMFARVRQDAGRLDILINNAGWGLYGKLADFSTEDLDTVLNINLRGTFLCCREGMKIMTPQKSGYIINISSVVGIKGYPDQAAYGAAKHGIMGITKTLAVEAQEHDIRVSAVLPGGVDTFLVRQARPDLDASVLMQPEDIAETVMFLLSLSDRAAIDQIYIRRRRSAPF